MHSPSKVMAGREQCALRSTNTPIKTCFANLYICIKRRVGHSIKWAYCKGNLVPSRKQSAYKLLGAKSGLLALKEFQNPSSMNIVVIATNNTTVVSNIMSSQGPSHYRLAECDSRQAIQARPDHTDWMASPSVDLPVNMQQVALASNRPICHEV